MTSTAGDIPLKRPEPIARIDDILYLSFERPDLEQAARFLSDFGLVPTERQSEILRLRTASPWPLQCEVRRASAPRYVGAAFLAASRADLEALSKASEQPLVPHDEAAGGGVAVCLRDPAGFGVTVVHDVRREETGVPAPSVVPVNTPFAKPRVNRTVRPAAGPATLHRLGHVVLQAVDFRTSVDWYMRHLGLIPTDVQCLSDGTPNLAFLRCDRGPAPADHHTVVVFGGIEDGYAHSAWEVADLDALGMGQQALKAGGWQHLWGIGRHLLGSQLFDYWRDPWGDEFEHYADGDLFDASAPTTYHPLDPELIWQWGADLPKDFGPQLGPAAVLGLVRRIASGRLSLRRILDLKKSVSRPARPWLGRR